MSLIVEKLNRYYNNHFLSLYDYIIQYLPLYNSV